MVIHALSLSAIYELKYKLRSMKKVSKYEKIVFLFMYVNFVGNLLAQFTDLRRTAHFGLSYGGGRHDEAPPPLRASHWCHRRGKLEESESV